MLVAEQKILNKIYVIRGEKVMLDRDLAEMYGVETKVFNQSVKRNIDRFPKDFMFTLSEKEWENLRSQFVTSSWGGIRCRPNAFTEQGVGMQCIKQQNRYRSKHQDYKSVYEAQRICTHP